MKLKEKTIERKVTAYYKKAHGVARNQIPFTQKRIDIVTRPRGTQYVWAIELKIDDWKSALRQANLNTLTSDFSYVGIWHAKAHVALKNQLQFRQLGIGLIVIGEDFTPRVEIPACLNKTNAIAYASINKYI